MLNFKKEFKESSAYLLLMPMANKVSFQERLTIAWKQLKRSRTFKTLIFLIILNLICAEIYAIIEQKPFYLAIYWASDVLANLGTGIVPPHNIIMYVLTLPLMWVGLATTLTFVNNFYMRLIKKRKTMTKFQNHVILIGWCQKMRHFLYSLTGLGAHHDYVLIADLNERPYDLPEIVEFIQGDPSEERVLKSAGILTAKQVLIALESDSEALLVSMTILDLNSQIDIIVNILNGENVKHLQRIGIKDIVCDEYLTGNALKEAFYRSKKRFSSLDIVENTENLKQT